MTNRSPLRQRLEIGLLPIWMVPVAVLLIIWSIGPARYVGYGGDDYQYLVAAQCVADHFWCIPTDHWARRAPIVLPVAASIRLFGLNQMALWLAPAFYAIVSVMLFAVLLRRLFGVGPAVIGTTALVLTPAFAELTPALGIDIAEFLFLMLAAFAVERSWATGKTGWSAAVGIAAALAVICRPTALAGLPIIGIAFWRLHFGLRATIAATISFAAVLVVEAGIYLYLTGDPFLTWKLSLRHTSVQSSELVGVDVSRSPIFNVDIIRAWRPAAGVEAHWAVKGLVNFAAHQWVFLLAYWTATLGVIAVLKRRVPKDEAWLLLWLIGMAAVYFGVLTYVLAVDPQPRLFVGIIAILCTIFGVCAVALSDGIFIILVIAAIGSIVFRGLTQPFDRYDLAPINRRAIEIEDASGRRLPIYPVAVKGLALTPGANSLPVYRYGMSRLLIIGLDGCVAMKGWAGLSGWAVEREVREHRDAPRMIEWLRRNHLFVKKALDPTLCILSAPSLRHNIQTVTAP